MGAVVVVVAVEVAVPGAGAALPAVRPRWQEVSFRVDQSSLALLRRCNPGSLGSVRHHEGVSLEV